MNIEDKDKILKDIFGGQETLMDELESHVYECDIFGKVLQHPLVYMVPFIEPMSGQANRLLRQKRERIIDAKSLEEIVWLYERPYRLDAIRLHHHGFKDKKKAILNAWTDSENIMQNAHYWLELLRENDIKDQLEPSDIEAYRNLPKTIEVWRGGHWWDEMTPLSWTTDKEKAEWFKQRFDREGAMLFKGKIAKDKIFFYTDLRNEEEVVVDPDYLELLETI